MADKDESIADLLVETCETSIRTTVRMIKVPIKFYAEMMQRCAKAIEAALKEYEPDGKRKGSN